MRINQPLLTFTLNKDDPKIPELLDSLEKSGMKWMQCACGQKFLTRSDTDICPPCRDSER